MAIVLAFFVLVKLSISTYPSEDSLQNTANDEPLNFFLGNIQKFLTVFVEKASPLLNDLDSILSQGRLTGISATLITYIKL